MAKPILGGAIGLLVANLLLYTKVLARSFSEEVIARHQADVAATKSAQLAAQGTPQEAVPETQDAPMAPPPKLTRFGPSAIATIALVVVSAASFLFLPVQHASLVVVIAAILTFLIGVLPRDAGQTDVTDEVLEEISFPFVRREVLKEVPFLAVPILFAVVAYYLPFDLPRQAWLARLLGSLMGMLVGGGIVWIIRIGGTLGFNKEAMGMGDAHLMAGVGAIVGAPLVIIAFLTAPFIGILWAIVLKISGKPNVLPYGPWLSVASILSLLLGNSLLLWYLAFIFPPIG
jgi:prepilin signal peptidase PulO-like enzyme (type II secretory pathway)